MPKREVIIGETTSIIKLTKGFEATISNDKLPLVEKFNWCAHIRNGKPYAARHSTLSEGGHGNAIHLHRAILQFPEGLEVDHIDGDTLNNTNDNLRVATSSQNQHNQRLHKNNTTGVHGVDFHKRTGKYRVRILLNGKSIHIGFFSDIDDARAARLAAKPIYHGNYGEV